MKKKPTRTKRRTTHKPLDKAQVLEAIEIPAHDEVEQRVANYAAPEPTPDCRRLIEKIDHFACLDAASVGQYIQERLATEWTPGTHLSVLTGRFVPATLDQVVLNLRALGYIVDRQLGNLSISANSMMVAALQGGARVRE